MANPYYDQLYGVTIDKELGKRRLTLRNESSGDSSGYNETINKMILSGPKRYPLPNQSSGDSNDYTVTINKMIRSASKRYPLPQLSSEDLQNKQAPAVEILPTEDERGWHPNDSDLEVLKESGLSQMLDSNEVAALISKRPKKGKMYSALETNANTSLKEIRTREEYDNHYLEDLIDMGSEIADAASVLMFLGKSTNEIESVSELAQKSAMVLQVAYTLQNEGAAILSECISKLRSMNFDQ